MSTRKQTAPQRDQRAARVSAPKQRDFVKEYQELMKLAVVPVKPVEREWNQEGDTFREFTLFDDERGVVTTTSVMF